MPRFFLRYSWQSLAIWLLFLFGLALWANGEGYGWLASPGRRLAHRASVLPVAVAPPASVEPSVAQRLARLEEACFGLPEVEASLSPAERLRRLERYVYGPAAASGQATPATPLDWQARLNKLEMAVLPTATASPASSPEAGATPKPSSSPATPEKPVGITDYPVLSEMETRVLGKRFPKEDLSVRVPRLETKVFGGPQAGSWVDRVDKLKASVLGNALPPSTTVMGGDTPLLEGGGNQQTHGEGGLDADTSSGSQDEAAPQYSPEQMQMALNRIEKELFKATYPQEPISARLDRIEVKVFQQKSPNTRSDAERFQRLLSVADVGAYKPTRWWDNNTVKQLVPILIMLLPLLI